MTWFRINRSGISVLALVALALQMLLALGHVHDDRFNGGRTTRTDLTKIARFEVPPPPQNPRALGSEYCAVCASIELAGSGVAPTTPEIVSPDFVAASVSLAAKVVELARFTHAPFGARGPPLA